MLERIFSFKRHSKLGKSLDVAVMLANVIVNKQ